MLVSMILNGKVLCVTYLVVVYDDSVLFVCLFVCLFLRGQSNIFSFVCIFVP